MEFYFIALLNLNQNHQCIIFYFLKTFKSFFDVLLIFFFPVNLQNLHHYLYTLDLFIRSHFSYSG